MHDVGTTWYWQSAANSRNGHCSCEGAPLPTYVTLDPVGSQYTDHHGRAHGSPCSHPVLMDHSVPLVAANRSTRAARWEGGSSPPATVTREARAATASMEHHRTSGAITPVSDSRCHCP